MLVPSVLKTQKNICKAMSQLQRNWNWSDLENTRDEKVEEAEEEAAPPQQRIQSGRCKVVLPVAVRNNVPGTGLLVSELE